MMVIYFFSFSAVIGELTLLPEIQLFNLTNYFFRAR